MPYDPTIFEGTAPYYTFGRPAYSRDLAPTLIAEAGGERGGRLLDVGCGPGILALALADAFEEVIALDPDRGMLDEGARQAVHQDITNIRWVQGQAENIAALGLGTFRLVTFGQSFHWIERERVTEMVYDCLEPGGVLAIITHAHATRPQPQGPGHPPIPHDAIRALLERYLGPERRAGQGFWSFPTDPHEGILERSRFGNSHNLYCPGREDIVQDSEGVLANYFSTSFAAPHLFGAQQEAFAADVRDVLNACSPSGLFWDWPGDTQILLARKSKGEEYAPKHPSTIRAEGSPQGARGSQS